MKQVIRKGLKQIIVDDIADPVVAPHHVLVRPVYSLISSGTETADIHTDNIVKELADNPSHIQTVLGVLKQAGPTKTFHEVMAKLNTDYAVLGYSGAGVVVATHPTVRDLEIGQRVSYGGEGTGHGETILAARNLVARMPESVSFQQASFTTLGSIALNAVRVAEIQVGETIVVIGLGLVGQLVCQLVRCQGGIVAAVDLQGDRVKLASDTGVEYPIVSSDSTLKTVMEVTSGRGADCVIVAAASKSSIPVQLAAQMCRDRGRIVVVGAVPLNIPRDQMYIKDLRLLMARAYGPGSYDAKYEKQGIDYPLGYVRWTENRNMEEFLRLVGAGRVDVSKLISHEFPLTDAANAYATIMDPATKSLAVLLRYPLADAENQTAYEPSHRIEVASSVDTSVKNDTCINVGLVGAGNLAKWEHLPNIAKIDGIRLRAVYSASGARGKSYAKRFGAEFACTDFDELLRDPKIDAILVASRHQHHADQVIRALKAGKHVFVEKPLALTEDECRRIVAAVRESGRELTVGFNRRFAPFYVKLKQQLRGRTGPAIVTVRMNSPGLVGDFWAANPEHGGALVGEGCHFVDLMTWLLDSEPVRVSAYTLPTGRSEPIGENNIVASFQFADGSIGNFTYCTIGSKTSGGETVEVFAQGAAGTCVDFKALTTKRNTRSTTSQFFAKKGYLEQMEDFASGLRSGKSPQVTVTDGVRATIGCLMMLKSAKEGSAAPISLDSVLGIL